MVFVGSPKHHQAQMLTMLLFNVENFGYYLPKVHTKFILFDVNFCFSGTHFTFFLLFEVVRMKQSFFWFKLRPKNTHTIEEKTETRSSEDNEIETHREKERNKNSQHPGI